MTYAQDLHAELVYQFGTKARFMSGWDNNWMGPWQGQAGRKPVALVLHHTAGAATSSTNPANAGNKHGANDGQINYVAHHFSAPASNFVLDRDGCLYTAAAYPCWHSGLGEFTVPPWKQLGVPKNRGNEYMLGVEIVSKGLTKDFTAAQKEGLVRLIFACADASDWATTQTYRLPRHRDWAVGRKGDILYTNAEVQGWIKQYAG
jgi:hypothetical protein